MRISKWCMKNMMYVFFVAYLMVIVFRPYYLTTIPLMNKVMTYSAIILGGVYFFRRLYRIASGSKSISFYLLIHFYFLSFYFSAMCNGTAFTTSVISSFVLGYSRVILIMYSMHFSLRKEKMALFFNGAFLSLFMFVIINVVTIIRNPLGLSQIYVYGNNSATAMYFLGNSNGLWYYLVITVTSALMYYVTHDKHRKLIFVVCLGCCLVTPFITTSLTTSIGVMSIVVVLGLDLFRSTVFKNRILKAKSLFLIVIAANAVFILLDPEKLFSDLLLKLFGRNASFIARTNIWNTVKELVAERLFIGHGIPKESNYVLFFSNGHSVSAHNSLLQIMYFGGLIGVFLLLLLVLRAYKGMKQSSYEKYGFFACIGLFGYGIAALTEVPTNDLGLIFLLMIIYCSKYITEDQLLKVK